MFDEIGYWSEIKLEIIKEYASAYSTILANQAHLNLQHVYIDAFAGAGVHISKRSKQYVSGSPLNALLIEPRFKEFHLIDLNGDKTESLRSLTANESDVHIYNGDCNQILLSQVFPKVQYKDYRRGLCILDPYGLHLNWNVIETAGKMGTLDVFLNFPTMDMNRNALWRDSSRVDQSARDRMTAFWGDESWHSVAYPTTGNLFGWEEKAGNDAIAEGFKERLKTVAGFKYVPTPIPMRNSVGAVVYYLFFASHKDTANNIVSYIFNKYKTKGKE